MELGHVRVGDRVMITAKDDFFTFIDGWRGSVAGFNSGLVEVRCPGQPVKGEGPTPLLTFFVPPDQLAFTV